MVSEPVHSIGLRLRAPESGASSSAFCHFFTSSSNQAILCGAIMRPLGNQPSSICRSSVALTGTIARTCLSLSIVRGASALFQAPRHSGRPYPGPFPQANRSRPDATR